MERCQMFLWWCPKAIPDNSGWLRLPPADYQFFPFKKKHFFLWYTFHMSQNHHSTNDLKFTKITIVKSNSEFNISFFPIRFTINELWSVFNRSFVPNIFEHILPHMPCSLMGGIFSHLSKSLCKFSFLWLTVMTPWCQGNGLMFLIMDQGGTVNDP